MFNNAEAKKFSINRSVLSMKSSFNSIFCWLFFADLFFVIEVTDKTASRKNANVEKKMGLFRGNVLLQKNCILYERKKVLIELFVFHHFSLNRLNFSLPLHH